MKSKTNYKHTLVNKRCQTCKYCTYLGGTGKEYGNNMDRSFGCIYCLVEDELRGCPAGAKCNKYKPKKGR